MQSVNGANKIRRRPVSKARLVRVTRGMTLADAGAMTGVAPSTLSLIERGITTPKLDTIQRLAAGYGVPLTDLIDDDPRGSQS